MSTFEQFTSTLQQAGMYLTPQRLAVCKVLSESTAHLTATAIHAQVRVQYPSLSLMTVYNTLKRLVDLGAINALGDAGDDNVHYDASNSPHINLACLSCHTIVDMDSQTVIELDREISSTSGFKVLGTRIVYYGLCPDCQKSNVQ
jgi:Fur family peroxide stress response transcriptional regulator